MRRLLDYNEGTKTKQWFVATDDGFNIEYEQDCEPIIEANKDKQTYGADYYKSKSSEGEYWKVASIPLHIWFKWLNEEGVDAFKPENEAFLKRKLNEPDWRYLKTAEVII